MAFEAKRLRVQLPCGQATVHEERPAFLRPQDCDVFSNPNCPTIFDTCAGGGVTFPECAIASNDPCDLSRPCRFDSFTCAFETCAFRSPCGGSCVGFASPGTGTCRFATCRLETCGFVSPTVTQTCRVPTLVPTCLGNSEPVGCDGATDPPVEPGRIVVDPAQLPLLRRQLEAQLAEVEQAEQQLKERGQG